MRGTVRDGCTKFTWPDNSELMVNYENDKLTDKVKLKYKNEGKY